MANSRSKKVASFTDIKNKAAEPVTKKDIELVPGSQIELAELDPITYYSQLLDRKFVSDVQAEIANVINESPLIAKYDPLTLSCGMVSLLEDTIGMIVGEAIYSSAMVSFPDATPEEIADKVQETSAETSKRIFSIRSYIAGCLDSRNKEQMEQLGKAINTGETPDTIIDKPAESVLATCDIFKQAIEIMVSAMKHFVEVNNKGGAVA